jgi:ABC-type nitrate/sulfonate/bicarbonate transport system permease component
MSVANSVTGGPALKSERPRMTHAARIIWTRRAVILGLLVALEIYTRFFGDRNFFSPPSLIVQALYDRVFTDERIRGAIWITFVEVAVAYVMSVAAGLVLGLLIGWSSPGRKALYPIVLLLYAIPQVILLPLFVLVFGIGPAVKIAFGFTHGIFPVVVNVIAGMRNVSPLLLNGSRSMGASSFDVARHVYFPHMVTSLFAGLRLAMTLTLLGVILGELYVSTSGIGYFTKLFAERLDPAPLFALITVLAVMAILLNELVRVAERRFTRWKR